MSLTQDQLKAALSYDADTGVFAWLDAKRAGKIAGTPNSLGYLKILIKGKFYYAHRLAWLYVYGKMPVAQIDHINGIRVDNRICNLRECSSLENHWNLGIRRNNQSGFRGVSWHKMSEKWRSQIKHGEKIMHIGYYATAEIASAAYETKAREVHGEFYRAPEVKA